MLKEGTKFHLAGKYLKLRKLKSFRNTWNLSAILCPSFSMHIQTRITAEIYSHTSLVAWQEKAEPSQATWKKQKSSELPGRRTDYLCSWNSFHLVELPASCLLHFKFPAFVHCFSFRNGCLVMQVSSSQFCPCNSSLIFLEVTPTKLISSPRCTLMAMFVCFLSRESRCLCIPRNSVIQHIQWPKGTDITEDGLVRSDRTVLGMGNRTCIWGWSIWRMSICRENIFLFVMG